MTLVQSINLTLRHNQRDIIRDASFQLRRGAFYCLLGANGCGKTTLLRCLLGIQAVANGELFIAGSPVAHWTPSALSRIIAWVPQTHHSLFAFRALEMVMMGCHVHLHRFSSPGPHQQRQAQQYLEKLNIGHLAQRLWSTLSGGEQQMVLIARALMQQPQLLLMDEPASSLDFGHQIMLLETLRQLKNDGITLLMSTHHPDHARAIADSVVLIGQDGKVTQDSPDKQLNCAALAALYRVPLAEIHRYLHFSLQKEISC